jgi:histidine ammonia-lyase
MQASFSFGSDTLTPKLALALAHSKVDSKISAEVHRGVAEAHDQIVAIAQSDSATYGINTGFGPLCATIIPKDQRAILQEKLLRSHSVGMGKPVPILVSRLMLIQKLHALCLGKSGVSPAVIERILWLINHQYSPVVPSQGSVGASGDLAPLSHLFLPLIGEGHLNEGFDASLPARPTIEVYAEHGLEAIELGPKDGLALINGTQFIAAHAVLAVDRLENCLKHANLIGAMMVDGIQASTSPFNERLHALRPHAGAVHVANSLRQNMKGSEIPAAHADCERVQDPYSIRCMPQVHGASYDAWKHLHDVLTVELNSVTDNPVLVGREEVISGGSFHGQPMALPIDYATLAAAELGSISERRIYLSLLGIHPNVPTLLMKDAGLDSGYMILQYTAAALVSENKTQCFPASADSIPTGMGQEDHVSMGSIGSRKLLRVVRNLERVLAIELLCAGQALDFQRPLKSGKAVEHAHAVLRKHITHATEDRIFAYDMKAAEDLVKSGALLARHFD